MNRVSAKERLKKNKHVGAEEERRKTLKKRGSEERLTHKRQTHRKKKTEYDK